jgi:hypothetical protein
MGNFNDCRSLVRLSRLTKSSTSGQSLQDGARDMGNFNDCKHLVRLSCLTTKENGGNSGELWLESRPLRSMKTSRCTDGRGGPYTLHWPCRRTASGWINSRKGTPLEVTPVRWKPYLDRPPRPPRMTSRRFPAPWRADRRRLCRPGRQRIGARVLARHPSIQEAAHREDVVMASRERTRDGKRVA